MFALGIAIAYRIKGNTVASTSRDFIDDAQFAAVQNALTSLPTPLKTR